MKEESMSGHGTLEVSTPGASTSGEVDYLDGFVPSTFDSPHSSLLRGSTWIGMGLILVSLAGFGAFVYGFAVGADDTSPMMEHGTVIGVVGLIVAIVLVIAGAAAIHVGRSGYRSYTKATGRVQ